MHASTCFLLSLMGWLILVGAVQTQEDRSQRTRDVVYGRRDGLALTLDVFRPAEKPNGAGVLLMVSGNFSSASNQIQPLFSQELLRRGYTVFAVVHGSQPRYTVLDIRADIRRAVCFVRHRAGDYGIDPNRLAVGGASSGGLLALQLGVSAHPGAPQAKDPADRLDSGVQAVAAFFPPTDYLNYGKPGNEVLAIDVHPVAFRAAYDFHEFDAKLGLYQRVTGRDQLRALYRDISPIYRVTAKSAPTLLIHGDKDELVPLQQSEVLLAKFKEVGVPARLEVKKGAGHGWLTILSDMTLVADWFDTHLQVKGR